MSGEAEETFELVWAKLSKFPSWPALGHAMEGEDGGKWLVFFFGSHDYAEVSESSVESFRPKSDGVKVHKLKLKMLSKAFREALAYEKDGKIPTRMAIRMGLQSEEEEEEEEAVVEQAAEEAKKKAKKEEARAKAAASAGSGGGRKEVDSEAFAARRSFRLTVMARLGLSAAVEAEEGGWLRDLVRMPGLSASTVFASPPSEILPPRKVSRTPSKRALDNDDDADSKAPAKKGKALSGRPKIESEAARRMWTDAEVEALKDGVARYRGPNVGKWKGVLQLVQDNLKEGRSPDDLARKWKSVKKHAQKNGVTLPEFTLDPTKKELRARAAAERTGKGGAPSSSSSSSTKKKSNKAKGIGSVTAWEDEEYFNLINLVARYTGPPTLRWTRIHENYPQYFKPFRKASDLRAKWSRHRANKTRTIKDEAGNEKPHPLRATVQEMERRAAEHAANPKVFGPEYDLTPEMKQAFLARAMKKKANQAAKKKQAQSAAPRLTPGAPRTNNAPRAMPGGAPRGMPPTGASSSSSSSSSSSVLRNPFPKPGSIQTQLKAVPMSVSSTRPTQPPAPRPAASKPAAPRPMQIQSAAPKPAAPKPAASKPAAPKPAAPAAPKPMQVQSNPKPMQIQKQQQQQPRKPSQGPPKPPPSTVI